MSTEKPFEINIIDIHWLKNIDERNDLCAHGFLYLKIGDEIVSNKETGNWTLSSTALSLLRSIDSDYTKGDYANQLLPCCGHFFIADENEQTVIIQGCETGIDWKIIHVDANKIKHVLENGKEITIDKEIYKQIVFDFADKVEQFYIESEPKNIPEDEFDRKGYLTFWKEWKRLREKE